MTDPNSPRPSSKRAKLCSIEHANRVATQVAEHTDADTVVVRTSNPLQPFRVVLASKASSNRYVSRVLTCK
jgi:arginine/ornithine N-succinyltransferase beta subunit